MNDLVGKVLEVINCEGHTLRLGEFVVITHKVNEYSVMVRSMDRPEYPRQQVNIINLNIA